MKKRSPKLVLFALMLGLIVWGAGPHALAQEADYTYTTINGKITITGYTGSGGAVIIPSTIDGLPVTGIADRAFQFLSSLTRITIGRGATIIGNGAFSYCTSLTSVTIPNSVTSIGGGAFYDCPSLTTVTVEALNSAFSSMDGVLFNKDQTTLLQCPGGKAGSYSVPNSVTSIEDGAFAWCTSLTGVTIPSSIRNIGYSAFRSCTSLTAFTVDAPNANYSSVDGVLFNKSQTTLIQFPGGKAGGYPIPKGVTSIGIAGFFYCTNLTSVTIPDSVTLIGDSAFVFCCSLTSVTIPRSVTSMGTLVFEDCTSLAAITVDPRNTFYSSVDGVYFNKAQTTLLQFPGGKAGSYTIPNGVTTINLRAFAHCGSLSSVTIPCSVSSIGGSAFSDSYGLTAVYFTGNAPTDVGWGLFLPRFPEGVEDPVTIYYLPGTTGWDTTFDDRPTLLWDPQGQPSIANVGVRTNQFGFDIMGVSGMTVIVEASSTPTSPTWSPAGTNTLTDGYAYFSDPDTRNHARRFYRVRSL